jgi:signal transduction histidine kinase
MPQSAATTTTKPSQKKKGLFFFLCMTTMKLRAPIVMSPEMEEDYEDTNYGSLMRLQPSTETTRVSVEVNRLKLALPKVLIDDEEAAKEWIWQNCKSSILSSMSILHNDEPSELDKAHKSLMLLDHIAMVQQLYLKNEEPSVVFGTLLDKLLELMQSEYGFIGEIKHEADGTMFLQTHAITNIAWNAATQAFYEDNKESGLKFTNLKSLFGHVMVNAEPMIANEPGKHPSSCGIPEGHPPLNHFLGIPFFEAGGTTMTGMVGIANKHGGYSEEDIKFLEPFTATCSNLIRGYNAIRENKNWINILEERVAERTKELQLANIHLEDANQKVVKASKAQLQHFACMSHEIRTPLNCIIGLSSLLQETELNPYQNDSLRMIMTSGDLLLTVVNDVLDYSKLESGHVDIDIKKSDIQEALDAVVHSVAQKAKSKQLTLQTYYGTNVPQYAQTDSRRLQQILYNLLGNATKFSKDGGVVELHVSLIDRMTMTTGESTIEPAHACPHLEKKQQDRDDGTTAEPNEQLQPEDRCPFLAVQKEAAKVKSNRSAKKCPHHHGQEEQSRAIDRASSSRAVYPADVSSSSQEEDNVVIQEMAPSRHILRFMVKDYGTGIQKKDFGRIFMRK